MRRTQGYGLALLVTSLVVASGSLLLAAKFKSTWNAPGAGPLNFAGKKVVALVIADDQNLEISSEEALGRELIARGVDGVAAYRLIPREELRDKDKAKGWFTRANVAGVVVMRLVGAPQGDGLHARHVGVAILRFTVGYYGYGWGTVYVSGSAREDTVVTIETLVFDVPKDKLLWAGVSEKTNPSGAQQVVKDLVKEAIKEMSKVGLVPKGAT